MYLERDNLYCSRFEALSQDFHEVVEKNNDKSQRCQFPDRGLTSEPPAYESALQFSLPRRHSSVCCGRATRGQLKSDKSVDANK